MGTPLWKFEGFVTAAGGAVFQRWYWKEATIDERDALRDRLRYLENIEQHLWKDPFFDWFGDIGEIRKRVPRGALRVYGFFAEEPHVFVFLLGNVKKKTKDKEGIETARMRLKQLRNGKGTTHEFDREERATGADSEGQEGEGEASRG